MKEESFFFLRTSIEFHCEPALYGFSLKKSLPVITVSQSDCGHVSHLNQPRFWHCEPTQVYCLDKYLVL